MPHRLATLILAALALFGCAAPPFATDSSHGASGSSLSDSLSSGTDVATPPFFRVESTGGATLLLLGTIHLGPEEGWQLSPEIEQGLETADRFAMEIDFRSLDLDEVGSALARRVILPVGTLLDDSISPETAKLISENEALITSLGAPEKARRRLKPWYLATNLLQVAIGKTRYALEQSADNVILNAIGDRPLFGLETFDGQLGMLDELSPQLQDMMLRDTLGRLDETLAEMDKLIRAWKVGDRAALEIISRQGIEEMPELEAFYDILLTDRNRTWLTPLRAALVDPEQAGSTLFVAVGALHLVGNDGVPRLLEAAGYKVTTIH